MSLNASAGHLAPDPIRCTASPSAGATLWQAVAVVGARSAIRNGDGAEAAAFFMGKLAAHEVERVGTGAENQEGGEEGENAKSTHDEWCV